MAPRAAAGRGHNSALLVARMVVATFGVALASRGQAQAAQVAPAAAPTGTRAGSHTVVGATERSRKIQRRVRDKRALPILSRQRRACNKDDTEGASDCDEGNTRKGQSCDNGCDRQGQKGCTSPPGIANAPRPPLPQTHTRTPRLPAI